MAGTPPPGITPDTKGAAESSRRKLSCFARDVDEGILRPSDTSPHIHLALNASFLDSRGDRPDVRRPTANGTGSVSTVWQRRQCRSRAMSQVRPLHRRVSHYHAARICGRFAHRGDAARLAEHSCTSLSAEWLPCCAP